MATEDGERERTRIQTYVPAYQKSEWEHHADELDMSLSEFVRSMVQAGRRGFERPDDDVSTQEPSAGPSSTGEPQGSDLEEEVLAALSEDEHVGWDEILAAVTDDIEDRLDETIQDLQSKGTVTHSGRHGGYRLA